VRVVKIKQIEKDITTFGAIIDYLRQNGIRVDEYIKDYNAENVTKIYESKIKNEERLEFLLKGVANDCYKRIKKQFPKE
jgi:hypothetical protein